MEAQVPNVPGSVHQEFTQETSFGNQNQTIINEDNDETSIRDQIMLQVDMRFSRIESDLQNHVQFVFSDMERRFDNLDTRFDQRFQQLDNAIKALVQTLPHEKGPIGQTIHQETPQRPILQNDETMSFTDRVKSLRPFPEYHEGRRSSFYEQRNAQDEHATMGADVPTKQVFVMQAPINYEKYEHLTELSLYSIAKFLRLFEEWKAKEKYFELEMIQLISRQVRNM